MLNPSSGSIPAGETIEIPVPLGTIRAATESKSNAFFDDGTHGEGLLQGDGHGEVRVSTPKTNAGTPVDEKIADRFRSIE